MNPSDTHNPQTAQHHAQAQPPVNRPNEPHAGDHLSQYGMRAAQEIDGVQAFDDEYSTREARDQRPRSIPTGAEGPMGASGNNRSTPRE